MTSDTTTEALQHLERRTVERLEANERWNQEMMKKAMPWDVLREGHQCKVASVRTDRKEITGGKTGQVVTGEQYFTTVVVHNYGSTGLEVVMFDGIPPNIQRGDEIEAFIPRFVYIPPRTNTHMAAIKLMIAQAGRRLILDDDLNKMFDGEERASQLPLAQSIERFIEDVVHYSKPGAWVRRPLVNEERAYALAKIGEEEDHLSRGRMRRVTICGPNNDMEHPFYKILTKLEETYGKR